MIQYFLEMSQNMFYLSNSNIGKQSDIHGKTIYVMSSDELIEAAKLILLEVRLNWTSKEHIQSPSAPFIIEYY